MEPGGLVSILAIVAEQRGVDFRDYRTETLARGVSARLAATRSTTLNDYRGLLTGDDVECDELIRACLVPFTEFFRDPRGFQSLATVVLPRFSWLRNPRHALRVWSIGAATGEEAWSIAMLLGMGRQVYGYSDFEVVATDLDGALLDFARAGIYPWSAAAGVPEPLRSRFVERKGASAVLGSDLRTRVHFVRHDVVGRVLAPTRAVVASFDVILLRNVLIYFDRRLQEKALERDDGALVLGTVETLPAAVMDLFEVFPDTDPAQRIFRRRRGAVSKP